MRHQQDAIHKVVAAAEAERAKACALHEELNSVYRIGCGFAILTTFSGIWAKCSEKQGVLAVQLKKSEFMPDKAYLADFKELTDLIPVSDINTPNDPNANPGKDDVHAHAHSLPHSPSSPCGCVDPLTYVQSPPCKQLALSDSQAVYRQKLQDLSVLDREAARLDEELVRVKRLKEAEHARKLLLLQKLREIKADPDIMQLLYQG